MSYYHRYRGSRKRKQNRIKTILLIFALLVLVFIAALFVLQDKAVFTSDGFRFPFLPAKEENVQEDDLPDDVELIIEDQDPASPAAPNTPAQQEDDPTSAVSSTVHALFITGQRLLDEPQSVLSAIELSGADRFAIDIRTAEDKTLTEDSGYSVEGVADQAAAFTQTLSQLKEAPVAVFSALRDNVRPRTAHRSSALHTSSGATWLDREYTSWFDPSGKDTADCLLNQLEACRMLGFSQVVLTNFQFPTVGKIELIDFRDGMTHASALTELAKTLSESTDMPLGMVLTAEAAQNLLDSASGQDVAELAQYFDVLYAPADSAGMDLSALKSAVEGTDCRIGIYLTGHDSLPENMECDVILASK